jgi:hypothetical protein
MKGARRSSSRQSGAGIGMAYSRGDSVAYFRYYQA